ncbi:hypothetical protein NMK71_09645 [Weeksellaceae bacterium KMM 9713]|uniref:Rossmann fold nucleotide-binding protein n=1 Tax=Profundicola chukchiensis TaxID=2961959 RepID=A0A9X4RXL6_9FLAO|nr:hypothetical protein [Profundicola chukchiensis]MDG4946679.1 hypothetical protein [Profundicola chukchiensis]
MESGILINSLTAWYNYTKENKDLTDLVIQGINFRNEKIDWSQFVYENTTFLSCAFNRNQATEVISHGAIVYPKFKNLPYNPNRNTLYTYQELLEGYNFENDASVDLKIYQRFVKNKYNPPLVEAMAQRLHDFNIDESLRRLMGFDKKGMTEKKAVGFMGGHATRRGSEYYVKVAKAAKLLAEKDYYIMTGGGPGIMEAANLGAYMAGRSDEDLATAIEILSDLDFDNQIEIPRDYLAKNYVNNALKVLEMFPNGKENLAIPTWFYGHEPSNVFASHIAKYFSNSLREDTLLAMALYGVVYAPGSAGTTQEIFQEAAQNHYGTFGYYSPMVFLSKKRYVEDTSLYSVLHQLAVDQPYKELLYLTDDPELVSEFIQNHPPVPV